MIYSPIENSDRQAAFKCRMASILTMVTPGKQNISNEKKNKYWITGSKVMADHALMYMYRRIVQPVLLRSRLKNMSHFKHLQWS